MTETENGVRPGSTQDLSRRMDRIEQRQDSIEAKVGDLAASVVRVAETQKFQGEVSKLRFDAVEVGIKSIDTRTAEEAKSSATFRTRIEGIISGEIDTMQMRQGREIVAEYEKRYERIETRLDGLDKFETEGRLLGRVTKLLVGGNAIAIIAAIYAAIKPA